ncbi:MAG: response regulator transcription factor [Alistipes sp.]|nr:response regulator transcription factor [Alistipes sp.]
MRTIRCIAIDDEPLALTIIKEFCERMGNIEVALYDEPLHGLEAVRTQSPDLLFLDVEMEGLNGLEIAEQMPSSTALIFTTAYAKYAIDGFNFNALDFLHKPFAYERFCRAVEKVRLYLDTQERIAPAPSAANASNLVVKSEYYNVVIPHSEIIYIEAMENYCKIYRTKGDYIMAHITLKAILERLPSDEFLRVHRSYAIAKNKVVRYSNRTIFLHEGQYEVPCGRQYLPQVQSLLGK